MNDAIAKMEAAGREWAKQGRTCAPILDGAAMDLLRDEKNHAKRVRMIKAWHKGFAAVNLSK